MKKTSKKITILLLTLALVVITILIALYVLIYFADKENDKLVEQYEHKTIEVSSADEMDMFFVIDDDFRSSIKKCKAYFTPTAIVLGTAKCYHGSGELIVTEDYYNKLLNEYDDWKLVSGLQPIESFAYNESNILEYADDNFKNFIQNQKYFYSEKMLNSKGWLILLSQEKGKMYFFINKF